jgi:mRNA-degrading endonuclease RelE of RelBE toxin-antitoxin system
MPLFGRTRKGEGPAEATVVSPPYEIILARGVQEQFDAVEPEARSAVHTAISARGSRPWPAGERHHDSVAGPYHVDVAGYRIVWTVASFRRTVLVGAISKRSQG